MPKLRSACLAVVLILVAISLQPSTRAVLVSDRPNPQSGDFWEYKTKSPNYDGTERYTMTGTKIITMGSAQYDSFSFKVTGTGKYNKKGYGGTYSQSGGYYLSVSEFALVSYVVEYDVDVTSGGGKRLIETCTYKYDPPLRNYEFPLNASKTWGASTAYQFVCDYDLDGIPLTSERGQSSVTMNYRASAEIRVGVPAGQIDTIYIKGTGDMTVEIYFAPGVGFPAWERSGGFERILSNFKYTGKELIFGFIATTFYIIVFTLIIVTVLVVFGAFMFLRKRRSRFVVRVVPRSPPPTSIQYIPPDRSMGIPDPPPTLETSSSGGVVKCVKCGSEMLPTLMTCGRCGARRR